MKQYPYEPMNAIEFFLYEIARNTERLADSLAPLPVEEPKVEEAPKKRTRRKKVEETETEVE